MRHDTIEQTDRERKKKRERDRERERERERENELIYEEQKKSQAISTTGETRTLTRELSKQHEIKGRENVLYDLQ